jgi:hypothetical protein
MVHVSFSEGMRLGERRLTFRPCADRLITVMSKQTFTFPTGDFSHTDFAKLNKVSNQSVWTVYSAARKSGQIIPATPPERKNAGKGKPTLMWIVNPNYVAPVVPVTPAPATPATVVSTAAATPATPPVVLTDAELAVIAQQQADERAAKEAAKAQAKADKEAAKVAAKAAKDAAKAQAKLDKAAAKAAAKAAKEAAAVPTEPVTVAAAAPAVAPVETVTVPVVEVAPEAAPAPLAEVTPASAPAEQPFVVAAVVAPEVTAEVATVEVIQVTPTGETFQGRPVANTRQIDEVCPICGTKCLAADNDTGVYVWCAAPVEVCKANENPYGHANNEKNAYGILVAKYGNKS